jgi:erythromycin esterase
MSKGMYVQHSSEVEYETVLEYCRTLSQWLDVAVMSNKDSRFQEREWRDYYMANNFLDMAAHEKPGTKFVLWAHNMHVSHNAKGFVNGGIRPFGSYLEEAFGSGYYAFGFAFNKGSFQAVEFESSGKSKGLQEFTATPAKKKSLDWYFAQTNQAMFILNFRNITLPSYLKTFLSESHETREFGSATLRQSVDQTYNTVTPVDDYEGIIFINETHRSRPTETGMRKVQ